MVTKRKFWQRLTAVFLSAMLFAGTLGDGTAYVKAEELTDSSDAESGGEKDNQTGGEGETTPADILPTKRIDINKNYAKVKGEELLLEPKTPKAKRCISIPDFLYDDIHEYISKLYEIRKGDRIFYFTKSALEKEIKRASEKAGLTPIRVHDLRHSHASMLIELGFTPLEIADRLGHESVKTTLDTYSHLYPDKDQKLADRLNQFRRTPPEEST